VDSSLDESGLDDVHIFLHDFLESFPFFRYLFIAYLLLYLFLFYFNFEFEYFLIEFFAELSEEL
jgi:hypothetical protein